ncbi:MAG: cupin domain-containing protein [Acidobacteria bacterium]|nr:MAG: cupin domain-containing protein [Acidobacteriota bacterium]REK05368.1 MAG: cupin domain-containing protein [Acidobacteriota bacterium]
MNGPRRRSRRPRQGSESSRPVAWLVLSSLFLPSSTVLAAASQQGAAASGYDRTSSGTRWLESHDGLAIKVLVEQSNLGSSEVEVGEVTFPVDGRGGEHLHQAIEIFYVVSGVLEHVVNGTSHRVEPGGVAIVKPGDRVIHRVLSDDPVRAVVVWAPGGEAERLSAFLAERPVDPE